MKVKVEQRQHLVLPVEPTVALNLLNKREDQAVRAAYIYALRINKWTLQSVADALGVTRERVRQLEMTANPSLVIQILSQPDKFPVPNIPTTEVEIPDAPKYVEPKPETLARLLELQPLAQKVRYDHKQNREAAEEYTALLWHAHSVEGVPIYRLAKRLGITHGAIRFRLVRYGYLVAKTGKSKCYTPVKKENRISS